MSNDSDNMQEREFLWKQIEELYKLRERSIQTMGGVYNAYLTFLPIFATVLGLVLAFDEKIVFTKLFWIIIIITGIGTYLYGLSVFKKQILTHINQIVYTKKINMTRRYLIIDKDYESFRLLPTYAKRPTFGKTTYLEVDFSKIDIIQVLKWINISMISLTLAVMSWAYENWSNLLAYTEMLVLSKNAVYPVYIFNRNIIILSFLTGILFSYIYHRRTFNCLNNEARNKWNNELKSFFLKHTDDDFDFSASESPVNEINREKQDLKKY